jgi:hypothetical protein
MQSKELRLSGHGQQHRPVSVPKQCTLHHPSTDALMTGLSTFRNATIRYTDRSQYLGTQPSVTALQMTAVVWWVPRQSLFMLCTLPHDHAPSRRGGVGATAYIRARADPAVGPISLCDEKFHSVTIRKPPTCENAVCSVATRETVPNN